jgi:hypothetical protein
MPSNSRPIVTGSAGVTIGDKQYAFHFAIREFDVSLINGLQC